MIYSRASLEIGFWGNFKSSRYQIIGAGKYVMKYREYYKSEDSSGYSPEYWEFTEWILREEITQTIVYLTEDKEGFAFNTTFEPKFNTIPKDQDNEYANFTSDTASHRIIEYGAITLQEFEGESGYQELETKVKKFFLYQVKKEKYSVEIPTNENGNLMPKEREYYYGVPLLFSEVSKAFEENPKIKAQKKRIDALKFATKLSSLCCWIFLLAFIYAFFPEKKIFTHQIELKNTTLETDSAGKLKLDTLLEFYTPEWNIGANEVYLIELQAQLGSMPTGKNPAEMFVQAAVIDSELGVVNQILGEFWEEYGRDSDGAWREKNNESSIYIRTERAGKFSAWVSVERTVPMLEWTANIQISVYKYRLLWWYMLTYYLIAVTINIILMSYSRKYK